VLNRAVLYDGVNHVHTKAYDIMIVLPLHNLTIADDERRGRYIYSFLLLPNLVGRAMGRQEETHRKLGGRSNAGGQKYRAFRRHIHDDG